MKKIIILILALAVLPAAWAEGGDGMEEAVLGGGCFWCLEAVFQNIDGVEDVISGYAGGDLADPTYGEVSTGRTGHAEVVKIIYDSEKVSYGELLDLFFQAHDPTTLNRQGADVGTQYRSIILYKNDKEKEAAERAINQASGLYKNRIVTEVVPLAVFYPAEKYHQDYYTNNPYAGYCRVVIRPKLKKLGLE